MNEFPVHSCNFFKLTLKIFSLFHGDVLVKTIDYDNKNFVAEWLGGRTPTRTAAGRSG